MSMILPPRAEIVVIPQDKAFQMASEISDSLPVYPVELIKHRLPKINACAEIVVGADGAVSSIKPLYEIPECPLKEAEVDERFTRAVANAIETWEFFPAAVCTIPPGVKKDDACKADGATVTYIPIKLAFVFTFEVVDGHATVGMKRT